ncbi:uncharacterized protein GVI51_F00627 [Nakaseomyces glabratus]|uniref:Dolichyl-phosphate-mannose--protein mannosyltransferase n=2 Tax=Saccharomycotina TaxID=147537 RepID=Q6FUT7_CANGA|nr:uncharacterized protein CAGL0F00759g [Nakaseomyces glabratus]KTB17875.1 Dolichyl-phosphate-mannose--protein mannosyltransferase 2 [Nakaseomyces glabratus]KTB22335.1 Dolichyl-phosphate-mannose--protein mannosyltransferase 2 [Nakaseomyces glabratus]QHS65644.1 uncharacterized protein GVI51_F00627 [Nakaseomyces glabratus]UCS19983.1 uncharacterized protein GW608_F00605 [Nakaseomyces glabratus]UCS25214.1 uncharacterized protein HLK63_F00605 [Nakaseomyces glabratus]|eukprot:XP_446007.1 uncharacterized protein CAGL0F00759g [[Candida] glabrata]
MDSELRARKAPSVSEVKVEHDHGHDLANDNKEQKASNKQFWLRLERVAMPIVFTLLALLVRLYRLDVVKKVTWDEAHFGKFGSYYLRHTFYHDVHPPLGKMLVGFSGYLAGYNGSWDFPSGQPYPDYVPFVKMRIFQGAVSALCVPMTYFAAKAIGFSLPTVWLTTILVLCENSYTTLGKLILLDSLLLFFTVATFMCFQKFHSYHRKPFSFQWCLWLFLTGASMGCAISVKMVGLFVITLVGIHTIVELWTLLGDKNITWKRYANHWIARIICLIVTPFLIFALCFKIHFALLWGSGPGDHEMPPRFQAALNGTNIGQGPRDVSIGSTITLQNMKPRGAYLHSHHQTYPEGSKQRQVTCYNYVDGNNDWIVYRPHGKPIWHVNDTEHEAIRNGDTIRLVHKGTGSNLHSHQVEAPLNKLDYEVSGYGNLTIGDLKDHWVVEIIKDDGNEDKNLIHPITTHVRFRHAVLNCYLAQSNEHLPEWGFSQAEVRCIREPEKNDIKTMWIVDTHTHPNLEAPENFIYPRRSFWSDFFELNKRMMATNNALTVSKDKHDYLRSESWEWPTLYRSLRINSWNENDTRYLLLGSPASTWPSTVAVLFLVFALLYKVLKWNRQMQIFQNEHDEELFIYGGVYPLLGWFLHFFPFVIMGRVKYVHHYLPALYFALFVLAYIFDAGLRYYNKTKTQRIIKFCIYAGYMSVVIGGFILFAPFSYGMTGKLENYKHLNWMKNWDVV